jgi:hypothetical protein|tara:strand:- start:1861 stop:1989 length:129 start_codon:yes stop_codon:yes gene_type:complete
MKLVIKKIALISIFLVGCATAEVDVGEIAIFIHEPYAIANKL